MHKITEAVYDFIKAYIEAEGLSPSQREIAEACYIAKSEVIRHLDRLEAWGWIEKKPGRARGIRLLKK